MTPHARKGAALLYYQRQIIFSIQSESHAQPELVDFRLPGRQHPRPRPLHHPHLPLHVPGQGTEA